jgi:hypothetical protein
MNTEIERDAMQVFDLAKKLDIGERTKLFHLIEEDQYINNILEEQKAEVRIRIKNNNENLAE